MSTNSQSEGITSSLYRTVLGLDIGIASIGWSLLRLKEEAFHDEESSADKQKLAITDYEIVDMGVRTFAKSEDRNGKTLVNKRGQKRRLRRTLSRRKGRKTQLRVLLTGCGLAPKFQDRKSFEAYLFDNIPTYPTPWQLRVKALDEKLSPKELARVLYHIIGHRGFYFTSKSNEGEDAGIIKKSMSAMESQYQVYRTVGEYLVHQKYQRNSGDRRHSLPSRLTIQKKRNSDERRYQHCIKREWLRDELHRILQCQKSFGHTFIDDAFIARMTDLLMFEKGYDANAVLKMWGKCPFFPNALRAPKCSASVEYFTILQRVNNMRLIASDGSKVFLSVEEIRRIIQNLYEKKTDLTFAHIRSILDATAKDKRFNLCSYRMKKDKANYNPETEVFLSGLQGRKSFAAVFGARWPEMYPQRSFLDAIAQVLAEQKEDAPRLEGLAKVERDSGIRLSDEEKDALLSLSFKGTASYSLQALQVLIPLMEPSIHDSNKAYGLPLHTAIIKAIEDENLPDIHNMSSEERKNYIPPYKGDFSHNPIVCRAFAQTRKLINAIQKKHGHCIDAVHIEVGTEIANGPKRRNQIMQGQGAFRDRKQQAVDKLRECGFTINTANILKMRLYTEQQGVCPYSGEIISLEQGSGSLHFDMCEVDHILPFSRTFNDSMSNKVLVSPSANQSKGNRIPAEWLHGQDWEQFAESIERRFPSMSWSKKRTLLRKELSAEDRDGFISRNLNDMRYASRTVADYLRKYFRFSDARADINDLSRVQVVSGGITSMLRYAWGLNKDREMDDKHHAIDATVVACTTRGHVFRLATMAKHYESHVKIHFHDIFGNEERLRRDLDERLKSVNVSRMERHTVTGPAHGEQPYPIPKDGVKKAGRVFYTNEGWVEMGVMVRADIFCDAVVAKGRQPKNYIVPIYPHDFLGDTLPSKAIANGKPYEDWLDVSDPSRYRFCFSLFKDDLISLQKKGEDEVTLFYIGHIRGTASAIVVKPFHMPSSLDEVEKGLTLCQCKKYRIDILGNIHEIKQEKRQGTRKELAALKAQAKARKNREV